MKQILIFLAITLTLNSHSQISFEKGYYIDNNNKKTDCLIKNLDWLNNPTEFEYKISENHKPAILTIKSVKEFGVYHVSKYVRSILNIDRAANNIDDLSSSKNPVFKEEQLFLKVLVEGKSNLYEYVDGNLKRYFFDTENSKIEQLVYRRYKANYSKVGENNRFRQQLWNSLKCPNFKMSRIENLDYKKNELVSYFIEYNKCNDHNYVNYHQDDKKDLFNLTLRPRLNSASLTIENTASSFGNTDFGNKLTFGFGIEAEFILPFNRNKWAIAIEPTYQSYKSEIITNSNAATTEKVSYSSFELPFSLRHYLFFNDNSKIFVNASYVLDAPLGDSNINGLPIRTKANLAFGLGYKYKDRYSLEVRYLMSRDLFKNYLYWYSEYKTLSFILGYSLF